MARKRTASDAGSAALSRRERQIMDIIYARGEASAAQVREAMADAPSYSAVRAFMRILEEKGHLKHRVDGQRHIYMPTQPPSRAARSAMRRTLEVFYRGEVSQAVNALLDVADAKLTSEQIERINQIIEEAKKGGR